MVLVSFLQFGLDHCSSCIHTAVQFESLFRLRTSQNHTWHPCSLPSLILQDVTVYCMPTENQILSFTRTEAPGRFWTRLVHCL